MLASLNGISLHYEVQGEGTPLVLLHGFTGCGGDWALMGNEWTAGFQTIRPDLRGHGKSTNPPGEWTHRQAALDVFALLDHLGIGKFKAAGISAGANTLLHMAVSQPERVEAMVLVSATPYFPEQARAVMRQFSLESLPEQERAAMRARSSQGEEQVRALIAHVRGFADSDEDLNFTPPLLGRIQARALIVYGDRDYLYPVELAVEMYRAIPRARLWVVPGGSHGPVFGEHRAAFVEAASRFLRDDGA